ncbi:hypothetical protein ACTWPB_12350 [Nocardia sp. IBHARD005]|uniref:hypothetical protein n=1 Tax=Nocardia sp. IBHARD005 TaxID=3457765 RepID=UPI0040599414
MTGFLQVDIDVLGKTVQSLRSAEQVLTDAMKAMSKDGNADIGTAALNDAADNFQRRWQFGIERISESARVTADGVAQCLTAYQNLDTQIAGLITAHGNGIDTPSVAPGEGSK